MPKTFVLNTGGLNRYGYRVLTPGLQLENFKKNPVLLYNHDSWYFPIGRWENLRIEGDKLLGDAVFDENDERALTVKSKVEQGILNATSLGLRVLAVSSEDVVQGQSRETVSKAEITEISIVSIPANPDAVALSLHFPEKHLTLSDGADLTVLDLVLPKLHKTPATPAESTAPDAQLNYARLVEAFIELAQKTGHVTAENEKAVRKLLETEPELAIGLIKPEQATPGKKEGTARLSAAIQDLKKEEKQDKKEDKEPVYLSFSETLKEIENRQKRK